MSELTPPEEVLPEEEFVEYGDYDLEDDSIETLVVPATEALPYPDVAVHDDLDEEKARGFVAGASGVRSPEEAIAVARTWSQNGTNFGEGHCLVAVRSEFNVAAKYPTAAASWVAADHKHRVNSGLAVPRGVPVYWTGGTHGAGHIALSVGGGLCLSTDWRRSGRIDYARINEITQQWGLHLEGYANEINDVEVWKPASALGTVSLRNLHFMKKNQDVLEVKRRLKAKGYTGFHVDSPRYGLGIRRAYAKYQRRLGYTGTGANGIPGITSLKKLGFRVNP